MLDMRAFGARHRIDFEPTSPGRCAGCASLADDGLVQLERRQIQVTSRGRLLLRIVAMCFDAYLDETTAPTRHSRTI